MTAIIDTSFLLATVFRRDKNYQIARRAILNRVDNEERWVITQPVLTELFYMVTQKLDYARAIDMFEIARDTFEIHDLTPSDMGRMQEIMVQYQDAQFDFTDTSIMALAERLNITRIYTFDRRDFSMYRPRHTEYLELLP